MNALSPAPPYLNDAELALIAALESGAYVQCFERLRSYCAGNLFCVLGVASEISHLGEWITGTYRTMQANWTDDSDNYLTEHVRRHYDWATTEGELLFFDRVGNTITLASLNDGHCDQRFNDPPMDFPKLAQVIRAGLLRRPGEKFWRFSERGSR